jgi:hypothetical protein
MLGVCDIGADRYPWQNWVKIAVPDMLCGHGACAVDGWIGSKVDVKITSQNYYQLHQLGQLLFRYLSKMDKLDNKLNYNGY